MMSFLRYPSLNTVLRIGRNLNYSFAVAESSLSINSMSMMSRSGHIYSTTSNIRSHQHTPQRMYSKKNDLGFNPDEPVKFSESAAKDYNSTETFAAPEDKAPWYQKWSILISLYVFLVYFCVMREENDLDEEIEKSLYDKVPGLEESQLVVRIRYDREQGNDTSALEARLEEVRAMENPHLPR